MIYNTLENIEYCREFVEGVWGLLVYSHLFPIIASIVSLLIILLSSASSLIKRVFTGVILVFIAWSVSNLLIWINYDNNPLMLFAWSSIELLACMLFMYLLYFVHVLVYEKDVSAKIKKVWLIMLLPLLVFSFTKYNLPGVDLSECVAIENGYYILYSLIIKILFTIWLSVLLLIGIVKQKKKRKPLIIAGIGILFFLFSFFATGYLASITGDYNLEFYGLFGMVLFIVLLSFAINRYKIINIKIISTELLVLGIIILLTSQFFYLQSQTAFVLNAITFVFVSLVGFLLIKNIKNEIEARELIVKNSKLLEQANNNQKALIHFITHQVKGVLTKSRNIFDGMLSGEYGEISSKIKEVAQHGFDSDTKGVQTVQSILKASDLKTGKTIFEKKKVNASKIVAEVIEKIKPQATKKNLEISFDVQPNLFVEADEVKIKEVFQNLVDNAVIYTQKGEVKIVLKEEDSGIKFTVLDTGFGLLEEDIQRLFSEGGRGTDSLSVNVESTGYGLFIAKQIVNEHKGEIGAKSDGRDKGSEFFVILPKMQ